MSRAAKTNESGSSGHHAMTPSKAMVVPPKGWALAGWAFLPLRVFLGVTFIYAGMQKLANPNFFDANSPASIQAQLIAAARLSPIHVLIEHLLQFAVPLGLAIAIGELAIGVGILLGLWTRIAGLGGAVLSFSLFLTVSFHASPFYTGSDLVFFFAFMPFVVAGAGGVLSVDRLIARRAAAESGEGDPTPYAVSFASIQSFCGNLEGTTCTAQSGAACGPEGCPVLHGGHRSIVERKVPDGFDRRTVVIGSAVAGVAGVATVALAGATAGIGRALGRAPKAQSATGSFEGSTTTTGAGSGTTGPTPKGTMLGAASTVPIGGAATFTTPSGDPGVVLQPKKGVFLAYDAVCPHAGCTVSYSKAADLLVCPCHASEFTVNNGDVIAGPSPTGLTPYTVSEGPDGQLYLTS